MTTPERRHATGPALDPRIVALTGETLVELLERAVERTPDATVLVMRRGMTDERWSYRELAERSRRVAHALRQLGVSTGDRVLTWAPNDPWLVAAYFAIWRLGAAVVPLDLRMQTEVAVRIGARARPMLLLAGSGVDPEAAGALGVPVIPVEPEALAPDDAAPVDLPAPPGQGAIAEILFTSGTTSDPKGVVLTHAQVIHTARAIAQTGMGSGPDRALGIIPLSHMYGQSVPLLMGLITGSTLVFLHALTPKAIGATMRRERITAVTLVPHVMAVILQGIESEARRTGRERRLRRARRVARWLPLRPRRLLFRSVLGALGGELRVISSGGALLREELQWAWESLGVLVVQGYGTTEVAAVCGHSRRRRRPGTVGPPLAGLEVRIADDGELLARGPNVMSGYWEAPEATAEVLDADGWFHTGDAARIDDPGDLVILGRTRDRIALPNGLNVYPEDVEGALVATGQVRAAVVFEAAPGRLAAVLVPVDGVDEGMLDAAVRTANAGLAPHQRVGAWRRWPEADFPRTHTLKVRRGPVEAWYAESPARSDDAAERDTVTTTRPLSGGAPRVAAVAVPAGRDSLPFEALADLVSATLAETRGGEPPAVTPGTSLESLELDSLGRVTLALRIDEAFDAPLTDDEIATALDMGTLHELVRARQGEPPAPPPSRWAFSRPARLLRRLLDATLVGWALRIVTGPRVEGLEHLAGLAGPMLICPNHTSHLDAPSVRAALPAHLRDRCAIAAAADVWFDGHPVGPLVALLQGALPFGRTTDVRASLERVADLVNDGWTVIIFPEGTRSRDGRLGPMRQGIGLLATDLGVPVVPVHIAGAWEILPPGARLPRRRRGARVRVRFGAPLHVERAIGITAATELVGRALRSLGDARA
jgi:long-chain acyl-CoA synthetase